MSILNTEKRKKQKKYIVIIAIVLLATVYYVLTYRNVINSVTSDDAASQLYFYENDILGKNMNPGVVRRSLQVSNILARIAYILFGANIKFTWFQNGVRYGIIMLLALTLICSSKEDKENNQNGLTLWIIPLYLVFTVFQIPINTDYGLNIARFHLDVIIVFLLYLIIYHLYENKRNTKNKKWFYISFVLVIIYAVLQIDLLMIPGFFIPLAIQWMLTLYKKNIIQKYVFKVITVIFFILVILKAMSYLFEIDLLYSGYGARSFLGLQGVCENFIPTCNSVINMFGIDFSNVQVFSFETIFLIPKLLVFLLFIYIWCKEIVYIIKNKRFRDTISSLCSICVLMLFLFTLILGKVNLPVEGRYMAGILYILPIIACRYIMQNISSISSALSLSNMYMKKLTLVIGVGLCIILVRIPNKSISIDYQNMATFLSDNNFKSGVGDFWTANITSLLTKQKTLIQATAFDYDSYRLKPYMDEWDFYNDKSLVYDFITIDSNELTRMGISQERYSDIYGEPIDTYCIDGNTILKYDYDIRVLPKIMYINNKKNNNFGELAQLSEKSIYEYISKNNSFNIGKYRIVWKGKNLKDVNLTVSVDGKELSEENYLIYSVEDKVVCEISFDKNCNNVNFLINSKEKIEVCQQIDYCLLQSMALECYSNDSAYKNESCKLFKTSNIDSGKYQIIIKSKEDSDLKKINVKLTGNNKNIDYKIINCGKNKFVIEFKNDESQIINLEVENYKKINIESVAIAYVGNEKNYISIPGWALSCTDMSGDDEGGILVKPGEIQYGPYINIRKGKYRIQVRGNELENSKISILYEDGQPIYIDDVDYNNGVLTYFYEFDDDVSQVEFRNENTSDVYMQVDGIILEEVN